MIGQPPELSSGPKENYLVFEKKEKRKQEYQRNKSKYLMRAKQWVKENPEKRREILARNNAKYLERKRRWAQNKHLGTTVEMVRCTVCSSSEKLVVHHRDGNNGKLGKSLNNNPNNLVVVCRRCHPKIHTRYGIKVLV